MIFTSFNFLIFFPLIALIYYTIPAKHRWVFLLISSYFFYINIKPVYVVLLIFVTLSTYIFTIQIDKSKIESIKKTLMRINIVLILLPLFFFKYFSEVNLAIINTMEIFHLKWPLPEMKFLLPIGISFYTFMAIGYTVDVYNEEIKAEKNLGILALFISFFPLILSGPIERAKNMLPQFKLLKKPDYLDVVKGLKFMLWGYFMKLVVADRLGIYIDAIYNNILQHNGTSLLFASCLYPFQIYADFGGYSLIAIGISKILGFNVMQNFNRPLFSTSISELWRRWHISLISWLTDYIYTPLSFAFRKYKKWGIVIAVFITFIISGIWHGAALTFVVWGLIQAIYLSIEVLTNKKKAAFVKKYNLNKKAWYIFLSIMITYSLFVTSQIVGRAYSMGDAFIIYERILSMPGDLFIASPSSLVYSLFGLAVLICKEFFEEFFPSRLLFFENKYKSVRLISYSFIIIVILLIGVFDGGQFIYFQY